MKDDGCAPDCPYCNGTDDAPCFCGPTCDGNRIDYEAVAEELDDPATSLDDLDSAVVAAGQRYATATEKPWPPKPTHTRFTDWAPENFKEV